MGNELLALINRKDWNDLPKSWFSMLPSRQQMLNRLVLFHDEMAQRNRIKIVKDRQQEGPELFCAKKQIAFRMEQHLRKEDQGIRRRWRLDND
jgi:hypothetical protein